MSQAIYLYVALAVFTALTVACSVGVHYIWQEARSSYRQIMETSNRMAGNSKGWQDVVTALKKVDARPNIAVFAKNRAEFDAFLMRQLESQQHRFEYFGRAADFQGASHPVVLLLPGTDLRPAHEVLQIKYLAEQAIMASRARAAESIG